MGWVPGAWISARSPPEPTPRRARQFPSPRTLPSRSPHPPTPWAAAWRVSGRRVYATSKRLAQSRAPSHPGLDAHACLPAGDGRATATGKAQQTKQLLLPVASTGAVGGPLGVGGEAGAGDGSGWSHGDGPGWWDGGFGSEWRSWAGDGPERVGGPVPGAPRFRRHLFSSDVTESGAQATSLVREPISHGRETLSDIHITRELLRAVARGELSERGFARIETQHLESLCPVCRREIQAWRGEGTSEEVYEYALQALPAVLGRHASDLLRQLRQAERDLEELLATPPAERLPPRRPAPPPPAGPRRPARPPPPRARPRRPRRGAEREPPPPPPPPPGGGGG